jgi:hypothetical protein
MKTNIYLSVLSVTGLLALAACRSTPQMTSRPNFLSTYDHLQQVDDLNWRYVSRPLLSRCDKFIIGPVKVLFTEVDGQPITPEQRQRSADFVRRVVHQALADRYPVVTEPGPDVGEVRLAVTEGYRTGGRLGLCVQGEILDNSATQVAAVMRTELSEVYVPDWENRESARKMVGAWAERLRKVIDEAHTMRVGASGTGH